MEGCQKTWEIVLILWIHLPLDHINSHIDVIRHGIHDSALQFDVLCHFRKSCVDMNTVILPCSVMLLYENGASNTLMPLCSKAFFVWEKNLDWIFLLSCLSSLP